MPEAVSRKKTVVNAYQADCLYCVYYYPDVHDFSLRMQVIIANDYRLHLTCYKVTIDLNILEFIVRLLMEVEYV